MNSNSVKDEEHLSCEFKDNLSILREIYFFSGLPIETLKVFAYLCTREMFKEGEYLFSQGEDDGHAFYIISGKTILVHKAESDEQLIRDYGEGEFLGGLSLLGSMRRIFSLKSSLDTTCLVMTRDKFTRVIEQFPELMPKIFQAVLNGIGSWENRFFSGHAEICDACRRKMGVTLV